MLKNTNEILWKAYKNGCQSGDFNFEDYHKFLKSCEGNFDSQFNQNKENETRKINESIGSGSSSAASESIYSEHDTELNEFNDIFIAIFEEYDQCFHLNVNSIND